MTGIEGGFAGGGSCGSARGLEHDTITEMTCGEEYDEYMEKYAGEITREKYDGVMAEYEKRQAELDEKNEISQRYVSGQASRKEFGDAAIKYLYSENYAAAIGAVRERLASRSAWRYG